MNQNQIMIPEEYKPISMWGYVGYFFLFSIPCVGLIVLLILAFGNSNNNVKNFARGYLVYDIIVTLVVVLLYVFVFAAVIAGTGIDTSSILALL